jgi:hypothetical protein
MLMIVKLFYYCFLAATALLCGYYVINGVTGITAHNNPMYIKQWLGLVSVYGVWQVYKAYIAGEHQNRFVEGLYQLALCWLTWAILLLLYAVVTKLIK